MAPDLNMLGRARGVVLGLRAHAVRTEVVIALSKRLRVAHDAFNILLLGATRRQQAVLWLGLGLGLGLRLGLGLGLVPPYHLNLIYRY